MNRVTIRISDILGSRRMDVTYHKDNGGLKNFVPLSRYVDIKGGKRVPKGMSFSSERTNYLYLRLSDITDFENINYDNLKCISEDLYNKLKRYEIKKDQIVFSIAGTIGRVFLMKNIPEEKHIILTENCAMLLPKNSEVLPEYVSILLNCSFVQKQIEQNRIQTTIPKIGLDRISKIQIPVIPSLSVQQKIIEIYQDAINIKIEKRQEAKRLFNSIDDYLLNVLKICKYKSVSRKTIVLLSSIIGNRLDSPFHINIKNAIKPITTITNRPLSDIVEFSSENWDQKSIFVDTFPYIEISTIDTLIGEITYIDEIPIKKAPSRAKKITRKNDILISTTRPNRGAISMYNKDGIAIASTGFSVIRNIDKCILREYLYLLLRSSLSLEQMSIRSSGGNYPAIIESELKKVLIPIPTLSVQKEIIDTVMGMKNKAKKMQEEGNALIEEAKQKIESLIIG